MTELANRRGRAGVRDPELRFERATRWGSPSDHRPDLGPCLLYVGASNGNGYGQFRFNGKNGYAHRYAWERVHGPIPNGLTVDHLCRVRRCVNVAHMELTGQLENYLRGVAARDKCRNGHRYTPENTLSKPEHPGVRFCKKCEDLTIRRSGLRRTKAFAGTVMQRSDYDEGQRDQLVIDAVERRISVAAAAKKLGCTTKYMDKLVRQEARERGIANRRGKQSAQFDGWTERKTRVAVRARSGGVCERCDKSRATDMHHRKNRSQSGKWHPANILHLCALCHVEITAEPDYSRENGWSVLSSQDPEFRAVNYRGSWVYLDNHGDYSVVDDSEVEQIEHLRKVTW